MSKITVRALGEDDWEQFRDIRLTALRDSPQAFVATAAQEAELDEQAWRQRMRRARRMIADLDGTPVGVVCIGQGDPEHSITGELFGLWVAPEGRGTGVAWKLVEAGAAQALADGHRNLGYWVGTDNGPAVAFASSFGFRPTGTRRPRRVTNGADGAEELVMVLPLGEDPGVVPSTTVR
jgi:ribosomal protein S18 acetylase RimI-like enzyme